tara:strand:+ start:710 stop:847 length:138 start_codon:yes stop_codon:yes gene_type:complete
MKIKIRNKNRWGGKTRITTFKNPLEYERFMQHCENLDIVKFLEEV